MTAIFTVEFNFIIWCVIFLFSMMYLTTFNVGRKSSLIFSLLLVVNILCLSLYAPVNYELFEELRIISNPEIFFIKTVILILFGLFVVFLNVSSYNSDDFEVERIFLYITVFSASLFIVGCHDPLLLFIFIEMTSLATFGLIALAQTRQAYEAAIKYVIFSSISSCFFIIAFMLSENFYPGSFSTETAKLALGTFFENPLAVTITSILGQAFLTLTFVIKLGLGPYSAWVVDAYEAAKYRDFVFISTIGKMPVLFAFMNIFSVIILEQIKYSFITIIFVFAIGTSTMIVKQQKLRRFFAYSSIFNFALGFTLMLAAGDSDLVIFSYFAYYILLGLLTYTAFDIYRGVRPDSGEPQFISELANYQNRAAFNTFGIALIINSGLPPLGIFLIKATVLGNLLAGLSFSSYTFLVLLTFMFLTLSMVNMFAYFKVFSKILSFEKFKFFNFAKHSTFTLHTTPGNPVNLNEAKKTVYNLTAFFFILLGLFLGIYYLWVYIF